MKKKNIAYACMVLGILVLFIGNTFLGANREKKECEKIDNEIGTALFHSAYGEDNLDALDDVYSNEEAIVHLNQLNDLISENDYNFLPLDNICSNEIESIYVVGEKTMQLSEMKKNIVQGKMIPGSQTIKKMEHMQVPVLIPQSMQKKYPLGSKIKITIRTMPVICVVTGIIQDGQFSECVDTEWDSMIMPVLSFSKEAKTEKEEEVQEFFTQSAVTGYVFYQTAQEYAKTADFLNNAAETCGLKWKVEERDCNRFDQKTIPINQTMSYLLNIVGVILFGIAAVCTSVQTKQETLFMKDKLSIQLKTRAVIKSMVLPIFIYSLWFLILRIVAKNSIYLENMLREKGSVLFWVLVYGCITGLIRCKKIESEEKGKCLQH